MLKRRFPLKLRRRGNVPPISEEGRAGIARLVAKALNRNQILILQLLAKSDGGPITPKLASFSGRHGVPLSTLKLNARILRDLGLVSLEDRTARLTQSGRDVLSLLSTHNGLVLPIQEVN